VAVGRTWASMPTYVRVTVGTRDEMARFQAAFVKCMGQQPASAKAKTKGSALLHEPALNPSELDWSRPSQSAGWRA